VKFSLHLDDSLFVILMFVKAFLNFSMNFFLHMGFINLIWICWR